MNKEIKIEYFRLTKPRYVPNTELQDFINSFLKKGWDYKTLIFHSEILTYEIVFERKVKKSDG